MATQYKPSTVVTVDGVSKRLTEWATDRGTPVQTLIGRLKRLKPGESIESAITRPVSTRGGQNKGKKAETDVLVGDEVDRLLSAGNRNETFVRDQAMIALAYRAGLRCFEFTALMPKDVNLEKGTITVQHGKGDEFGTVAMDAFGWSYLAKWIQQRSTWSLSDDAPLFCTRAGGHINERQVRAMFTRRAKKAGLTKHVHPHGLRHTMASEMAAEGVPLIDISGALRHKNTSTTDTYLQRICPTSVVDAMKNRSRAPGGVVQLRAGRPSTVPPPDWLPRLTNDIGDRLMLVHDARTAEKDFKAVVLLFSVN